jgi:hypothetical protein
MSAGKAPQRFRAKTAWPMAWRLGAAAVALGAFVFFAVNPSGGRSGPRATLMLLGFCAACVAGAVHTWRTAPKIVVHEDLLQLGEWPCRAHGIEVSLRKGVRDEYERHPPMDVLFIHAVDEGGTPRTMKLTSREWPDIGAVESAVRALVDRATKRGYR